MNNSPTVARLFEPGEISNFSIENEQMHDISEPRDSLLSETQSHQSGYLLKRPRHRNCVVDDQFDDISGSTDRLNSEMSIINNPDLFQ
jgi:hypothetical protein